MCIYIYIYFRSFVIAIVESDYCLLVINVYVRVPAESAKDPKIIGNCLRTQSNLVVESTKCVRSQPCIWGKKKQKKEEGK